MQRRKQTLPSQGLCHQSCIPASEAAQGVCEVNTAACKRQSGAKLQSRDTLLPEHPPKAAFDPDTAAQKQAWDTGGATGHSKEEQNTEQAGAPGDRPQCTEQKLPDPSKNTKAMFLPSLTNQLEPALLSHAPAQR